MSNKMRTQIIIWLIAIGILALLFGMWSSHNLSKANKQNTITLSVGTILPMPRPVQAFQLTGLDNNAFTNDNFKNHWTMIFFGFTHCPMLCPTTLSTLNQVYQKLQHDQVQALPQVLFISVDPERDSIQGIKEYLTSFNPAFIGARGDKDKIDAITKQFNVAYAKVMQNPTDQNYSVDHSGTILLVDPQGQLYAIFSTPHNANNIAGDYEKIIANAAKS